MNLIVNYGFQLDLRQCLLQIETEELLRNHNENKILRVIIVEDIGIDEAVKHYVYVGTSRYSDQARCNGSEATFSYG